jgi:hypothetical protein
MGLMEEKVVFPSDYESSAGALGNIKDGKDADGNTVKTVEWFSCRERFASRFLKETTEFWFMAGKEIHNMVAFFKVAEDILNLPEEERTDFKLALNKSQVVMVLPKPFWREDALRRSLFTIFLRQGRLYKPEKKNFEEALYEHEYGKRTKNAIMRFLFGFTKYHHPLGDPAPAGWVAFFGGKDEDYVRKYLTKSDNMVIDNSVAVGSLFG